MDTTSSTENVGELYKSLFDTISRSNSTVVPNLGLVTNKTFQFMGEYPFSSDDLRSKSKDRQS